MTDVVKGKRLQIRNIFPTSVSFADSEINVCLPPASIVIERFAALCNTPQGEAYFCALQHLLGNVTRLTFDTLRAVDNRPYIVL